MDYSSNMSMWSQFKPSGIQIRSTVHHSRNVSQEFVNIQEFYKCQEQSTNCSLPYQHLLVKY